MTLRGRRKLVSLVLPVALLLGPFGRRIAHAQVDLTDGLIGHWKFNDGSGATARDSSGNAYNGTVTNAAWSTGMHGGALDFDGTGDYVTITALLGQPTDITLAAWVRMDAGDSDSEIISLGDYVGIRLSESGTSSGGFFYNGSTWINTYTAATYDGTGWRHLVYVMDDTNNVQQFYVDGALAASGTNATSISYSGLGSNTLIGRHGNGATTADFAGRIDDVRVYSRALNTSEIGVLARGAGLISHWKMDDGVGGTATDSAGSVNGTVSGAAWTTGKLCGALDFDAVDDYVDAGTDSTITDIFAGGGTFAAWIYPEGWGETGYGRVADKSSDVVASIGWALQMGTTNARLRLEVGFSTTRGVWTTPTNSLALNKWYHVAFVYDSDSSANDPTMYIDGVSQTVTNSTPPVGSYSTDVSYALRIGNFSGDTNRTFDGTIDDVRLYNQTLSAIEIQMLAATYTVIDLGAASSSNSSLATAINDTEQVAGFDETVAAGNPSAWQSQYCAITTLGTLSGGSYAEAHGINAAGKTVGWSDNGSGDRKAFRWVSGSGMTDLGTLTGRSDSEAAGINGSDEIVGTAMNFSASIRDRLAFLYLPVANYSLSMGMNNLSTLGGNESLARDLNDSGEVVGGSQDTAGNMRPFLWLPSAAYSLSAGMNDLGTLGGSSRSILHRAEAVNGSGEVVGMSYTAGSAAHAFLWLPSAAYGQSSGMNDLGVLTGGDTSVATDINDDGVVVGSSNVSGGAFHAFLWRNGTMTDLNDLIDVNSAWVLTRATGVNSDAEIVGWGTSPNGDVRAFMLVQTCSASATASQTAALGLPIAGGAGVVNSLGVFVGTAVDDGGALLAEVELVNAAPGDDVRYRVHSAAPGTSASLRSVAGRLPAFPGDTGIDRTLVVESTAETGSFQAIVQMKTDREELRTIGAAPEDMALFVLENADDLNDLSAARWMPAGKSVGNGPPTSVVGDAGYLSYADDAVVYWAVRDEPGVFGIGATAKPTDGNGDLAIPNPEPPRTVLPLCGSGFASLTLTLGLLLPLRIVRRRTITSARRRPPRPG